jgi:chromosome segregation ATPase
MIMTTETRSGLDRDQLQAIVRKLKPLATMDDETARDFADLIANDIIEKYHEARAAADDSDPLEWDRENLRDSLKELEKEIKETEKEIENGEASQHTHEGLVSSYTWAINNVDQKVLDENEAKLRELRERIEVVGTAATIAYHTSTLKSSLTHPIASISSVQKILRETEEAETFFRGRNELTEEMTAKIRTARERACWHRARKKLADLEIGQAGGNVKKVEKLRNEANALLQQDWPLGFPNEVAPVVE